MPGPGGRRRHGVRQVAGRRTGEHLEPELDGSRERDPDHAVLERVRRVAALVLDPQLAHPEHPRELVRADQPGPAGVEVRPGRDIRRDRQQAGVPPDAQRAGLDRVPGELRQVVGDLERAEALVAGVRRAERARMAAFAAGQDGWRSRIGSGVLVVAALVSVVLTGEASLLICPGGMRAAGRSWHLSRDDLAAKSVTSTATSADARST